MVCTRDSSMSDCTRGYRAMKRDPNRTIRRMRLRVPSWLPVGFSLSPPSIRGKASTAHSWRISYCPSVWHDLRFCKTASHYHSLGISESCDVVMVTMHNHGRLLVSLVHRIVARPQRDMVRCHRPSLHTSCNVRVCIEMSKSLSSSQSNLRVHMLLVTDLFLPLTTASFDLGLTLFFCIVRSMDVLEPMDRDPDVRWFAGDAKRSIVPRQRHVRGNPKETKQRNEEPTRKKWP